VKVFIAGPRTVKELDENIIDKLNSICEKGFDILIGDANGIDSSVQKILWQKDYQNVTVYASNGIARNNFGDWRIENIKADDNVTGFEFYAQKDLEMVKNANIGFMIWNGESKGTFNNIINLLKSEKDVILYYLPNKKFYQFKDIKELNSFLNTNVKLNNKLKKMFPNQKINQFVQACLF